MADVATGKIGVAYPKGHAKETAAKSDHINRVSMFYGENDSGGTLVSGDVVILEADGKMNTTATAAEEAIIAVVALNEDSTEQSIAAAASGWFQVSGWCPHVHVDGTPTIGDFLTTSTTVKQATDAAAASASPSVGTFGVALTSAAGTVEALLAQGLGWADSAHVDASSAVHGQDTGSHVVGTKTAAKYRFEGGNQAVAAANDGCVTQAVTFTNAFGSVPVVTTSINLSIDTKASSDVAYEIEGIETTGFTIRLCNSVATNCTAIVRWLAYGPDA